MTKTLKERFEEKYEVDPISECWLWTAATAGKGYGSIKVPRKRRQIYAHRLSYLLHNGHLEDDQYVCHTCDTPRCVNPAHLFLGSPKDNLQDIKRKDRHLRGERNSVSKLTEEQVERMHDLSEAGVSSYKIAEQFGIGQMTAWRIINGKRWGHVYERRRRK